MKKIISISKQGSHVNLNPVELLLNFWKKNPNTLRKWICDYYGQSSKRSWEFEGGEYGKAFKGPKLTLDNLCAVLLNPKNWTQDKPFIPEMVLNVNNGIRIAKKDRDGSKQYAVSYSDTKGNYFLLPSNSFQNFPMCIKPSDPSFNKPYDLSTHCVIQTLKQEGFLRMLERTGKPSINPFDPKKVKDKVLKVLNNNQEWLKKYLAAVVEDPSKAETYLALLLNKDLWEPCKPLKSFGKISGYDENRHDNNSFVEQKVNAMIKLQNPVSIIPKSEISTELNFEKRDMNIRYRKTTWHIDPSSNGIWTNNPQRSNDSIYTVVFSKNEHAGTTYVLFPYFVQETERLEKPFALEIEWPTLLLIKLLLEKDFEQEFKPYVLQTMPGELYDFATRLFHCSPEPSFFNSDSRQCFVLRDPTLSS